MKRKQCGGPMPGENFQKLSPYAPGLSIPEIRSKYHLYNIIKLASNENPLGASPLAQEAIKRSAPFAFRYPRSGNPNLAQALAKKHGVSPERLAIGNGSDEIIDMLIRMFAPEKTDKILCFEPCFSIYPIQAAINGNQLARCPLNADFSLDLDGLLQLADENTALVFVTTPDNPSGYCPPLKDMENFAAALAAKAPQALLVIDEAYMDFTTDEKAFSLLANGLTPANTAFVRTFSKSYGLAGLRVGYGILPGETANFFWRGRLPFSLNIIAEEAALAALEDDAFREATLETVSAGREFLREGLQKLGCQVWPSSANFLMFRLPAASLSARDCHEALLKKGVIIRLLSSYNLPENLRVSVGSMRENKIFLQSLTEILAEKTKGTAA